MTSKKATLSAILLLGVFVLISSTQNWLVVELVDGVSAQSELSVSGQQLSPPLAPLALALAALAAALAIAGRVFRFVLGALGALLGTGIAALAIGVIGSPLGSAAGKITELTGIGGADAIGSGVIHASHLTVWPALSVGAGVIAALLGVSVLLFGHKWRAGGRRYETASASLDQMERPENAQVPDDRDRFSDWDALSDGSDPSDADGDYAPKRSSSDDLGAHESAPVPSDAPPEQTAR